MQSLRSKIIIFLAVIGLAYVAGLAVHAMIKPGNSAYNAGTTSETTNTDVSQPSASTHGQTTDTNASTTSNSIQPAPPPTLPHFQINGVNGEDERESDY